MNISQKFYIQIQLMHAISSSQALCNAGHDKECWTQKQYSGPQLKIQMVIWFITTLCFPLRWTLRGVLSVRLSLFSDTFHFAEICILIGSTLGQYHRYWKNSHSAEISIISISLKVACYKAGPSPSLSLSPSLSRERGRESSLSLSFWVKIILRKSREGVQYLNFNF